MTMGDKINDGNAELIGSREVKPAASSGPLAVNTISKTRRNPVMNESTTDFLSPVVLKGDNPDGVRKLFMFYTMLHGPMGRKPVVTVCTMRDATGKVSRGMAIRSADDEWDREKAMFVAECYAKRGLMGRSDKWVTDSRAIEVLAATACPWVKHSYRSPVLSWMESRLLLTKSKFKEEVENQKQKAATFCFNFEIGGLFTKYARIEGERIVPLGLMGVL